MENRIDITLTTTDVEEILAAIETIRTKLPFLVALTVEESRSLARLGDKSRAFVSKAIDLAEKHPEILPGTFELDELQTDMALFETLYPITSSLGQLHNLLQDTTALAGSEAYTAARLVYNYAKLSNLGGELDPLIDDMKKRYCRKKSKAEDPDTEANGQE